MIDMNNLNQQLQLGREELAANDKAILSTAPYCDLASNDR